MKTTFAQFNIEHRRKMYGVQMAVMHTAQNVTSVSVTIYTVNDQGEKRTLKTFSTSGRQVLSQYNAKQFLTEALKADGTIKPKKRKERKQYICDSTGVLENGDDCPGCFYCDNLPTLSGSECTRFELFSGKEAHASCSVGLAKDGKWSIGYTYRLHGTDTGCGGGGCSPGKYEGKYNSKAEAIEAAFAEVTKSFTKMNNDFSKRDNRGKDHPKARACRKVITAIAKVKANLKAEA